MSILRKIIEKWPGKKYFGVYRFLPLFFGLGAALEFSMINWTVGDTNFCEYKNSHHFSNFFSFRSFTASPCFCMYHKVTLVLHLFPTDKTFKKRQAQNIIDEKLREAHIAEAKQITGH
jgi:Uncharacterised protein family UPF0640